MKLKSSNARVRSEDSWSEGNRDVPEQWQEGESSWCNWLGLPESPLGQIPGKPEATLTLPHKTVVSQHPERPQGQPKMRSEDRRAPKEIGHPKGKLWK